MSRRFYGISLGLFFAIGVGCFRPALADEVPDRPPPPPAAPIAAPVAAPVAAANPTLKPDSEGFVPDSRPPNMTRVDESISAVPLVATAYGFIWLVTMGFVVYTLRRTQRVELEIRDLEARISSMPSAKRS